MGKQIVEDIVTDVDLEVVTTETEEISTRKQAITIDTLDREKELDEVFKPGKKSRDKRKTKMQHIYRGERQQRTKFEDR